MATRGALPYLHDVPGAMAVLQMLYVDPDPTTKRKAAEWMEYFQHTTQAWQVCHELLTKPDSPLEARLFSAQTFRAKITYDLSQLPREQLPPLRDSLIASLAALASPSAPTGSRAVSTQLCLALSDLAIQMPEWENVVQGMIDQFGNDAQTVGVLLAFLKCLVEESSNARIPISGEQARTMMTQMISGNAESVLKVLTMYIQAQGLTVQITTSVFETLASWLKAGEIIPAQVAQTPLFDTAFSSLSSDELFDSAVDLLCDMIHETQEISDNVDIIQMIVPRLVALRPEMEKHMEDEDRIRGYCRLFCEAGETYTDLIVRHPDDLLPLVEAVAAVAGYEDLEIVQITFNFWYTLATTLGREPQAEQFRPILDIYAKLQSIIIDRLHFPRDDQEQTAEERDEFRMFRHRMGDTLKDCCHVLGATTCLRRSYDMVVTALSKPSPSWQEIEAPLFSMRSMGAEVDQNDNEVLALIMDMLPKLPEHPRIRYAAILVISRYTQWIDQNPSNLAFQLQYVSAGFEIADENVSAAAAQAMKFMCQDCNRHLVPFLPQLYTFITSVGDRLDQADMVEVSEAIGYVISSMPVEEAAQALQQFTQPLLQRVQAVASTPEPGKDVLTKVADALEQMDAFLMPIKTFDPFPPSCVPTAMAVYQVLDSLLAQHASKYYISERVGSILRRGLQFFPAEALLPVLESVMQRMTLCFHETGYASYLWIIGKIAARFGESAVGPDGQGLANLLGEAFEHVAQQMKYRLTIGKAVKMPDVMDDYTHCFMAYITACPDLTLSLPSFLEAAHHVVEALNCPAPEINRIALDVFAKLCALEPTNPDVIRRVFSSHCMELVPWIVNTLIHDSAEDSMAEMEVIMTKCMSFAARACTTSVQDLVFDLLPSHAFPEADRQAFMSELEAYVQDKNDGRIRTALSNLIRAARRARERGRQSRKSMGGA